MTPNHYMNNGHFTKHPLKKGLFRVPGLPYHSTLSKRPGFKAQSKMAAVKAVKGKLGKPRIEVNQNGLWKPWPSPSSASLICIPVFFNIRWGGALCYTYLLYPFFLVGGEYTRLCVRTISLKWRQYSWRACWWRVWRDVGSWWRFFFFFFFRGFTDPLQKIEIVQLFCLKDLTTAAKWVLPDRMFDWKTGWVFTDAVFLPQKAYDNDFHSASEWFLLPQKVVVSLMFSLLDSPQRC